MVLECLNGSYYCALIVKHVHIRLENNEKTNYFDLLRGNAQGDIISPFLFLLGYQILLLKLQFDLQIVGTCEPAGALPPNILPQNAQVSCLDSKTLAMADDASCLVMMDLQTLTRIKSILTEFGILSGLCCNIEKTVLVPVGILELTPDEILELGFEIKDKAIILGMEISNDLHDMESCAETIEKKSTKNTIGGAVSTSACWGE